MNCREMLKARQNEGKLPQMIAYNRIDGPGSSLDLREISTGLLVCAASSRKRKHLTRQQPGREGFHALSE